MRTQKTKISLHIFPIEDDGYHMKVAIKINGKNAELILDTGASRTVFDENSIVKFIGDANLEEQDRLSSGIGTSSMASKKVVLEEIQLGDLHIKNYEATVLDLMHVNLSYGKLGLDPVIGVLGGDILHDYDAVIDYANKILLLHY